MREPGMFGLFSRDDENAIDILKNDHDRVKALFDDFEKSEGTAARKKIVSSALLELKLHAAVEEEIFYPAVRAKLEKKIMNEADEEHHVAKVLIAELDNMKGTEDHYAAKFTVLSENVRHHIKEEENDILPKTKGLDLDFNKIGKQILQRKQELKKTGLPTVGEEIMVARIQGRGDSPAKNARKGTKARAKRTAQKRKTAA